jgi:hypothetical protein
MSKKLKISKKNLDSASGGLSFNVTNSLDVGGIALFRDNSEYIEEKNTYVQKSSLY